MTTIHAKPFTQTFNPDDLLLTEFPPQSEASPPDFPSADNDALRMSLETQIRGLKLQAQLQEAARQTSPLLQTGHTLLDLGGMLPVIGEPLDLVNGGLYIWEGDYGNAALCLGAMIPLGGVFATGGRLAKNVDTEALTRGAIADILAQTTVQAGKVAQGIRERAIKVNVLGGELYDKALKKFGIDPSVEKVDALAYKDQIYVKRDNAHVFRDIVHEGTHALDHLGEYRGNVHQWERRAFYHDQQFQKWVDGPLDFDGMNEMMEAIYRLY